LIGGQGAACTIVDHQHQHRHTPHLRFVPLAEPTALFQAPSHNSIACFSVPVHALFMEIRTNMFDISVNQSRGVQGLRDGYPERGGSSLEKLD
jgi:hypothetical protein